MFGLGIHGFGLRENVKSRSGQDRNQEPRLASVVVAQRPIGQIRLKFCRTVPTMPLTVREWLCVCGSRPPRTAPWIVQGCSHTSVAAAEGQQNDRIGGPARDASAHCAGAVPVGSSVFRPHADQPTQTKPPSSPNRDDLGACRCTAQEDLMLFSSTSQWTSASKVKTSCSVGKMAILDVSSAILNPLPAQPSCASFTHLAGRATSMSAGRRQSLEPGLHYPKRHRVCLETSRECAKMSATDSSTTFTSIAMLGVLPN